MSDTNELKISFTGKATLIIELEEHGPIELRIHDKDVLLRVMSVVLEEMNYTTPVDSYDKKTEKKLTKLLDF